MDNVSKHYILFTIFQVFFKQIFDTHFQIFAETIDNGTTSNVPAEQTNTLLSATSSAPTVGATACWSMNEFLSLNDLPSMVTASQTMTPTTTTTTAPHKYLRSMNPADMHAQKLPSRCAIEQRTICKRPLAISGNDALDADCRSDRSSTTLATSLSSTSCAPFASTMPTASSSSQATCSKRAKGLNSSDIVIETNSHGQSQSQQSEMVQQQQQQQRCFEQNPTAAVLAYNAASISPSTEQPTTPQLLQQLMAPSTAALHGSSNAQQSQMRSVKLTVSGIGTANQHLANGMFLRSDASQYAPQHHLSQQPHHQQHEHQRSAPDQCESNSVLKNLLVSGRDVSAGYVCVGPVRPKKTAKV